jgi:D-glycero-beta-D-manno-heptose 1-phosphate adenylyltransferase
MITNWRKRFLQKVLAPEIVGRKAEELKKQGMTIVTLNGTFDLLHAGHLHIIYEAKRQGMALIVALNTDASIKALKGEGKPYLPLEARLQMVAALEFVDYVTWFHEADPINFIKTVKPNVHVNGSEYGKACLEAKTVEEVGAGLHIVERIPGLSTTELVAKIRSQSACVS